MDAKAAPQVEELVEFLSAAGNIGKAVARGNRTMDRFLRFTSSALARSAMVLLPR